MKIMCDTNILLDVLLEREPFADDSANVLKLCEKHKMDGFVSASCVTDIFYLVRKYTHSTELAGRQARKHHAHRPSRRMLRAPRRECGESHDRPRSGRFHASRPLFPLITQRHFPPKPSRQA